MTNKERYSSISAQLPLFFKPWWLDIVCDGAWDVAIVLERNQIMAVWPYHLERKYGFKIIRNPLLTAYLGPYFLKKEEENRTQQLLQELWQQIPQSDFVQWTSMPESDNNDFFETYNCSVKNRVTYHTNLLLPEEELWQKIYPKRKNDIRKAEQDLIIKEGRIDIPQFVAWHTRSFGTKNKTYPYSENLLNTIILRAKENNAILSYTAKDKEGHSVAQVCLLYDTNKIYYLLGATAPEAHRGAVALMIWKAMLAAKQIGISVFDFEGSMDAGIARFFERFGAEKMNYSEISKTNSWLWKLKQKITN